MLNTELHLLEQSIQQSRKLVELGDSLDRLMSNRDFKKLILTGYFEQEAIRLVHLKADPNMQTEESQKAVIAQMDAIGTFNGYLQGIGQRAAMAARSLPADEETRDELLAEGD